MKQTNAKGKRGGAIWLTLVPLYLFTLVFVAGPLVYMFVLSFETRAEVWGVVHAFTWENYKKILQPVYLNTFWESFRLAITSTALICALGYPFGYFMAKLSPTGKRYMLLALMIPFWTSSLIRLYGWIIVFRANGTLDSVLQRGKAGLEPCGGRARLGRFARKGVFDGDAAAHTAGAALRCDPHVHPVDGAFLHRRYPRRQQSGTGGQSDPGSTDESARLAFRGGAERGADDPHKPFDLFV